MITAATLAGHRVTKARVSIPAWGCWYADAAVDGEVTLTGAVDLVIADLTLKGTVLAGGPAKGRSAFRIVAGAGGWGKTLPRKEYSTDAGVKLANVLGDAAREAGETLAPIDRKKSVGPAWVRPEDLAGRVLELVAPSAWYVGEDGVTRLGKRAPSKLVGAVTHGPVDRARAKVTLASEAIATILPGVVVDGLEAVDVLHEISAEGGLRSTVWGAGFSATSRALDAFRKLIEQLDPNARFRGVTEYRIVTQQGERFDVQPVLRSTGMPDCRRVPVRPSVPGIKATMTPGALVLVGFVDADPGRPYIASLEDPDGEGFLPILLSIKAETFVKLGLGARPVAGLGDIATIFPITTTINTEVLV